MEPRPYSDAGSWWTCSRHTKKGDLIFLWRARGRHDIKYLIQAQTDAYPIGGDKFASRRGWTWGCDFRPIYKFDDPITMSDLRAHDRLQEWNALKAQFRARCLKISPDDWQRLNDLASQKNPGYRKFLKRVESVRIPDSILLEEQLEDAIAKDVGVFKKFGYDLILYSDKANGISGRQFVCVGFGGRIDLLCRNRKTKGFTVIELKNVQATKVTFAQICEYMGYVQNQVGRRTRVDGIVVSRGCDAGFQQAVGLLRGRIRHIDVKELGFD